MEALQKDIPESDSEDEDYVPPVEKEAGLSINKRRTGGLDWDDDDDDDEDDMSDADLVDEEMARLRDGAGPSSAGPAGSSSAGPAGSSSAGPAGSSNAGAGGSSTAGAAGGSTAGAAGNSSASAAGSSGAGAAGNSSAGATSSAAAGGASAAAGTAPASLVPAAGDAPSGPSGAGVGKAPAVADGATTPAEAKGALNAAAPEALAGAAGGEPAAKKARTETGASANGAADPSSKKTIDDIWAEMNTGQAPAPAPAPAADAGLADWLADAPRAATGAFKVTRLADLEKEAEESARREERVAEKRGRTGLEGALDVVRGRSSTVTERTREQWSEFKKDAGDGVADELEAYKKDKDRYTERVAFLARSDVREWEYEQRGKKRR